MEEKEYTGLLAEPIREPSPLSRPDIIEKYHRAMDEKTRLLFQHYDIDPASPAAFAALAAALARSHVPGFREPPKARGAPVDGKRYFKLILAMKLLERRDEITTDRGLARRIHELELFGDSTENAIRNDIKRLRNPGRDATEVMKAWAKGLELHHRMLDRVEADHGLPALLSCFREALEKDPF